MNDRSITPVSSDPRDLEALTSNHMLLLRQNPSTSAGEFSGHDSTTRMEVRSNVSRLILGKMDNRIFAYFTENAEMVEEDA